MTTHAQSSKRAAQHESTKKIQELVIISQNNPFPDTWGIGLWPHGVPNSVRSALLNYMPKGTALIVEILNAAIVTKRINPQSFTKPELLKVANALGYAISEKNLFRYMKKLEVDQRRYGIQVFFSAIGVDILAKQKKGNPILTDLGIIIEGVKTIPKGVKNGNLRRREPVYYHLYSPEIQRGGVEKYAYPRILEKLHPTEGEEPIIALLHATMTDGMTEDEVSMWDAKVSEAVLNQGQYQQEAQKRFRRAYESWQKTLTLSASFPLPRGWALTNHSDYIRAYAHVLGVENEGEHISQSKWTEWLGISTNSVKDTLHRAGLMEVMPRQTVSAQIDIYANNVMSQINTASYNKKGYPASWEAYSADGKRLELISYNSKTVEAVTQHLRESKVASVKINIQMAYSYSIDSQLPVKVVKKPSTKNPHKNKPPLTPALRRAKPLRTPVHDPQWLAEQARMVMESAGYSIGAWKFVNKNGEIMETNRYLEIVLICVTHVATEQLPVQGKPSEQKDLDPNSVHQAILDYMAERGYQKVA